MNRWVKIKKYKFKIKQQHAKNENDERKNNSKEILHGKQKKLGNRNHIKSR